MEEFSQLSSSIQEQGHEQDQHPSVEAAGRPSRKLVLHQRYEPYEELRDNSVNRNKKKKTVSIKVKNNDQPRVSNAPLKRPRGRPPLTEKNSSSYINNNNSNSSSNIVESIAQTTFSSSYNNYTYNAVSATSCPAYVQDNRTNTINDNSNNVSKEVEKEVTEKAIKISASQVTQRILTRLMTENPLEMSELVRGLPDVPKDIVQSCIDTAQVLGIVIAVQMISDIVEPENIDMNSSLFVPISEDNDNNDNSNNDDDNKMVIISDDNEYEGTNEDKSHINSNIDSNIDSNTNADATTTIDTTTAIKFEESVIEEPLLLTVDTGSNDDNNNVNNPMIRKEIDDSKKKKKRDSSDGTKMKQKRSKLGNTSPIGIPTETVYYTMAGLGKCSESVDVKNIMSSTESKILKTKAIKERMKLLEEISTQQMSQKDRTVALKNFFEQILLSDSSLYGDHVYRFMIENVIYSKQ